MTRNQIVDLAKKYRLEIAARNGFPKEYDRFSLIENSRGILEHIAWMCKQMETRAFDIEQINRWLGFVQGVLWSNSNRSIEEMCQENSDLREKQK